MANKVLPDLFLYKQLRTNKNYTNFIPQFELNLFTPKLII